MLRSNTWSCDITK